MIKQLEITNHLGESLVLVLERPDLSGLSILDIEGLGPPKAIINTSKVLSVPGSIFNSATSGSRNIIMKLGLWDIPSVEKNRQKTFKYFPIKQKVTVKVTTDERVGITEGYVESNEPEYFSKDSKTIISINCPDSFFKKEGKVETVFSGTVSGFSFPFSNNSITEKLIVFGGLSLDTSASIFYTGDSETGLEIYIHFLGEASGLSIYNVDRRETMTINSDKLVELTGSGFIQGDDVEIITEKGKKRITLIRSGERTNILNCLDVDADWFQIQKGDNLFTFVALTGQGNVQLKTRHSVLYEGL